MSDLVRQQPAWITSMQKAEPKFIELAKMHGLVEWKAEANFARQAIQKNPKLQQCTGQSIADAIINVAVIGLTLSPMEHLAHLVPRSEKIDDEYVNLCRLEIGYQGLIKIVTDSGSADYIRADVVREGDDFVYKGPAAAPEVSIPNPFGNDRGSVVGAYAIAKLANGETLCEIMNAQEIKDVEDSSKAKFGPWKGPFRNEMIRKTVIKRLCKTIPRPDNTGRLQKAIHVSNEIEGLDMPVLEYQPKFTEKDKSTFDLAIQSSDEVTLYHLSRSMKADSWIDLSSSYVNSAPRGKKGEYRSKLDAMTKAGHEKIQAAAADIQQYSDKDQKDSALEMLELFEDQRSSLEEQLMPEVIQWIEESEAA